MELTGKRPTLVPTLFWKINLAGRRGLLQQPRADALRRAQQLLLIWLHVCSEATERGEGTGRLSRCPRPVFQWTLSGPFDLRRGHADAVTLMQPESLGHRQAIHSDEVILGFAMRHPFPKQLADRAALGDFDRVGETTAIVVDEKHLHEVPFWLD